MGRRSVAVLHVAALWYGPARERGRPATRRAAADLDGTRRDVRLDGHLPVTTRRLGARLSTRPASADCSSLSRVTRPREAPAMMERMCGGGPVPGSRSVRGSRRPRSRHSRGAAAACPPRPAGGRGRDGRLHRHADRGPVPGQAAGDRGGLRPRLRVEPAPGAGAVTRAALGAPAADGTQARLSARHHGRRCASDGWSWRPSCVRPRYGDAGLWAALQELPRRRRAVVVLRYREDLPGSPPGSPSPTGSSCGRWGKAASTACR